MNTNPNQRLNLFVMNKFSIFIIALFILFIGILGCSKEKEIVKSSNNIINKSTILDNFSPKLVCEKIISNGEEITTLLISKMSFDEISVFYQNLQKIKNHKEYENYVISKLGEKKAVEFGILMSNTDQLFNSLRKNNISESEISKMKFENIEVPDRFPCRFEAQYEDCIIVCESTYKMERIAAIGSSMQVGATTVGLNWWLVAVGGGTPASLAGVVADVASGVGAGGLTFAYTISAAIEKFDACRRICQRTYCY